MSDAVALINTCPPGLEALLDVGQLVVHTGHFRHDIIFNARNKKRMEVIDEMRHVLFYIEQEISHLSEDSMLFKMYNNFKQEVAQVYIPPFNICLCCGLSWHWIRKCHFQAIVYAPLGVIIGFIRRKWTFLIQEFEILSPQEEVLLRLRGSLKDLEVYSRNLEMGIGRLSVHNWVGIMHEVRRNSDDIGLTFPIDLDVRLKCLLMAATFVIAQLYSTHKTR